MINYRSFSDLAATIQSNLSCIPRDFDVIVGIPRSGLLAANILSLYLHLPITNVEGLIEGRLLGGGTRLMPRQNALDFSRPLKVFVLDDSVNTGQEMTRVREKLQAANLPHTITYGAVYATPESCHLVDFHFDVVPSYRVFQWNLMHHNVLKRCCVDIDGVLCRDPTTEENDNGPRYEEFLKNTPPLFLPTIPIGWLVTCRREKYRDLTEQWLKRHGIIYQHLVMLDESQKPPRTTNKTHAAFKAKIFTKTKATLFIESCEPQAREIANLSGKQVYCAETAQMHPLPATPNEKLALDNAQLRHELAEIKGSRAWKTALLLRRLRAMTRFRGNHN